MSFVRRMMLCVLLYSIFILPAFSATIHVPSDQPTIQAGIDAAANGDVVLIADGTYSGAGNRDLDFSGKAITVQSENGPSTCIIDCEGTYSEGHRGFYFHSGETATSAIVGITVINGYVIDTFPLNCGGAVLCDNASPEIRDCTFDYCGGYLGGAVYCRNSSPTIHNSTVSNNSTFYTRGSGGGIYLENSSPVITYCYFYGNYAYSSGGGLFADTESEPVIGGSTADGNRFELNWALSGTDLGCESRVTPINARSNVYSGFCHSDYYVSPQDDFDLRDSVSELIPVEQDVYVSTTGDNSNDGTTWDTAYKTLTFAVSQVYGTDSNPITMHIGPGTFSPTSTGEYFPLPLVNHVSIEGAGTTIFDVEKYGPGFYGNADTNITISGLTVSNGYATNGGGLCLHNSSPTIANCTFTDNIAISYGGAIFCSNSSPVVRQCLLSENSAFAGGGIYCDIQSSPVIGGSIGQGNFFEQNYAPGGADLAVYPESSFTIIASNNSFAGYHLSDYYVSPVDRFNLGGCSSQTSPIEQDVFVSPSGNDSNDGLSRRSPFRTIQHALSQVYATVVNPVIIHLDPGSYSNAVTGEIFPLACVENVSLDGAYRESTVLDAAGSSSVVVAIGEDNCTLSDLTIQGGFSNWGAGIYIESSQVILNNCKVTDNTATYAGGGIYSGYYSAPQIYRCVISDNTAYSHGGGIVADEESVPAIVECRITDNMAVYSGGGLWLGSAVEGLTNCLITGNETTGSGGGLTCFTSSAFIQSCTFSENSAEYSGGAVYSFGDSSLSISNSILWNDYPDEIGDAEGSATAVSFSDIQGGFPGNGNIDADPRFVHGPGHTFFLSQVSAGQSDNSPCLNSGSVPASSLSYSIPSGTTSMDELTTRTDFVTDLVQLDLGYHFTLDLRPVPAIGEYGLLLLIGMFSSVIVLTSKKRK